MDASAKSLEIAYRDELVALVTAEGEIRALANTIMQRTARVERLHIARQEVARVTGQPEPVDARPSSSRGLLAQLSALGIIPTTAEPADYGVGRRAAPAAETVDSTLPDPERAEIPQDPLFDTEDVEMPQRDGEEMPKAHHSAWFGPPRDGVISSGGYLPEPGTIHGAERITGEAPVGTVVTAEAEAATVAIPAQAKTQEAGAEDANLTELTYKVLADAVEPLSAGDVARALGAALGRDVDTREVENTRNRLNRLKKVGRAEQPSRGLWIVPTVPLSGRKRKKAAAEPAAESVAGH